ncbi:Eukaryotic translation initiation factor 3 subunit B [Penicillium atrosanguineum]|uniref:Eukaryotic translation initiation factor 3 subunit B n=1 Tax=Penicillium atrosanguineum TaxID=1132637 RepID=UPI00238C48DA|nr:Eukaryotic translation initiation factor 3 subunit B [Penicillium atrosanguineum]KAJ5290720.1 Eukaryotic translation initiation factor 3 subunit B [Penicillium atrosanguineum]
MTSNVFDDAPNWGMTSSHDVQNPDMTSDMRSEEFGQPPFLAENFPLVMNGDFDPWMMQHYGWNGGIAPMSEQFSEKWEPTNVGMEYKEREDGELAICAYSQTDFGNSVPQWDGSRDTVSQLATERALFMTPSAYPLSFSTYPGSPISDLSSTPDVSHGSGLWETDYDRSSLSATTETYVQALKNESQATAPGYFSGEDEDDYPTTLEMPDGSTRRTSNWLPVDPQAGFTIGSHTFPSYTRFEHMEDVQKAFISPNTAGWKYDG